MSISRNLSIFADTVATSGNAVSSVTIPVLNGSTTLSLQTGGTTAAYFDASQNVGVGNTSPSYKLDVTGTARATTSVISPIVNGATTLSLQTGGTTGLYLDASQNVGIGTSSPYGKLMVAKAALSSFTGTANGAIYVSDSTSTSNYYSTIDFTTAISGGLPLARIGMQYTGSGSYLNFGTSNNYVNGITNTAMTIDYSGNVGIGTTTPANTLDVESNLTSQIRVGYTAGGATAYYDFGRDSADGLFGFNGAQTTFVGYKWKIQGTEAMRIDSSGNVGIGTTSPLYKLHVSGSGSIYNLITNTGTGPSNLFLGAANAQTQIIARDATTGAVPTVFLQGTTESMRIDASGNLLVGTTGVNTAYGARLTLSTDSGTTKWAVGPYSTATNFVIGAISGGGVYLAGTSANAWSSTSDERMKNIIEPITDATTKIKSLRAIIGTYKNDEENRRRSFLIAQDVQQVLPEAVHVGDDEQQTLGLAYTDVIPLLVAAIQELTAEVTALKAKVGA